MTAIDYAKAGKGDGQLGHCLLNVRMAFAVPARYPDAYSAWRAAGGAAGANTHTVLKAPPNVPLFWSGGAHGYGHVAISAGVINGVPMCYTTDMPTHGKFTLVPVSWIRSRWGLKLLGWSETLNGVRVHPHMEYKG